MTQPMQFPDPARPHPPGGRQVPGASPVPGAGASPVPGVGARPGTTRAAATVRHALAASLAVVAGTALLGVAGGFAWAVVAPRAGLVIVGRGAADVVNSETNAFIAADGWYGLVCLAGGVISGLLGYRLAVRRHGPVAMAGVLAGALAAALITLWIGQQSGLATFHHLLATAPVGAHMQAQLELGSRGAIAFWPLAAGLMAGGIELSARMRERRQAALPLVLAPPGYPGAPPGYPGTASGYPGTASGYPGTVSGYPGTAPGYPGAAPGFQGGPPGSG
jgi:hypothetical protein